MNKRPKLDFKTTVSLFFRLLGRMFRGHPVMFLLCIPTIIVGVAVQSIGALFIGQILINQFIEPSIAAGRSPDQIIGVVNLFGNAFEVSLLTAVLTMAGLYLLGVVCVFLYRVMACIVGQSAQMGIRNELFEKMESLPLKYFDTRIHGDIMSVYTNDVDTLRELTFMAFALGCSWLLCRNTNNHYSRNKTVFKVLYCPAKNTWSDKWLYRGNDIWPKGCKGF